MTVGLVCLAAVLLLAFLRVPLGIALLTVSIGGIGFINSFDVARTLLPMTLSEAAFSYELAVVPMFILMGNVLSRTGISEDLFRAAYAFFGAVRGGLALATMVTCAGFSAVCGSSFATAATMAKVAYPSMQQYGYSDRLASATIAAGGTLGILIPPSIILMIYGILTQQNIGELFIAGMLPGLLGLAMYMGVIYLIAWFKPEHAPRGNPVSARERWQSLAGVWPCVRPAPTTRAAASTPASPLNTTCPASSWPPGPSWRCSCSSSAASTWAGSPPPKPAAWVPAWPCSSLCCSVA